MLPKVNRDDAFNGNGNNDTTEIETNKVVRILSATASGFSDNYNNGRGVQLSSLGVRRPISTKSARLTTIPLEPGLLPPPIVPYSPTQQRRANNPYSVSSPITRGKLSQQNNSPKSGISPSPIRWNGAKSDYYKSRAQSHRSMSTWSARAKPASDTVSKSMPYLVPKTAKGRVSSSTGTRPTIVVSTPDQQLGEEKISTKVGDLQQTPVMQLVGGTAIVGTGKGGGNTNGGSGGGSTSAASLTKDRIQVCRTKEEREKSPDAIRLDKRGVRIFPDIGGGESSTLKLLSLQHNLITRLENVPLLSQLVVLDLYDNRVERICGLQGLPSLRVLLLGKNRIKRIEGLDSLKRLEILDLHGNQLRYVDNLGPLSSLRVLNLAGNLLRNIRNLGPYGMSSLIELNLKRNRIKNLDGLQKTPHLKKLLLANNDLQNISSLAPLRKLTYLNELVIDPNPLLATVGSEYYSQVLTLFPNLESLDRNPVTEELKQEARIWHRKKLEQEELRKMEEERVRQEMSQSVGPPGSREQVIFQARRRWESLKKFVKSSNNAEAPVQNASSTGGKKPVLKSMKKVVTVATEVKVKKQAELLYPPATLDLEEFPDGQEKLDQMESMLSCASDNSKTQNVPKKQKECLNQSTYSNPVTEVPVVITDEKETAQPNSVAVENSSSVQQAITPRVDNNGDQTSSENHSTDSQCPSSARSGSAKVAVVRPLIHRSTTVEISPPEHKIHQSPSSIITSNESKKLSDCLDSNAKMSEPALLANLVNVQVEILTYQGNSQSPADNPSKVALDIVEHSVCELESHTSPPIASGSMPATVTTKIGSNSQVNPVPEEKSTEPTATINTESARVKSKLLKHLRSISLDSCPHPFLRPGATNNGTKTEDGSSLNSPSPMIPSDDDDGEEDDDNDNEVIQDYDCDEDDAYSITTSTCTTSGSTPRRSSTVMATTNRLLKNGLRKQSFPRTRSQRFKMRDRAAKLFGSTSDLSPRSSSGTGTCKRVNSGTGTRGGDQNSNSSSSGRPAPHGRILRRCDSAASLSTSALLSSSSSALGASNNGVKSGNSGGAGGDAAENQGGPSPFRKQGTDFLVEVEGKMLNVFGQGGLRHALTAFASNVTCHVITAKFHYITYDSIIPFFGKLRQVYPSLEHFHFRANNLCTLAQLDSLSDLQGLTSLYIAKEGNPLVAHEAWAHYSSYRLSHWGLQIINGKEVCSEYRGGASPAAQAKGFESLGFLALSCLPQSALTPLAKRLHMLHCFCCCSPSTSSDESNRRLANGASNQHQATRLLQTQVQSNTNHNSSSNFCTAWDDDPVLLDVIGKEALVYCPSTLPPEVVETEANLSNIHAGSTTFRSPDFIGITQSSSSIKTSSMVPSNFEKRRAETLGHLVDCGVEIVEKVDMLERTWPTLMTEVIQEMLMDYRFMDSYLKKELKKCQDIALINQQQSQQHHNHGHHQHGKKIRH